MISTATYTQVLINRIMESIQKHGGDSCLSSVVLTGSFGRGEPTIVHSADNTYELKSDVEIALVFPATVKKRRILTLIDEVSQEFEEDLNLLPICESRIRNICNYNMSFFTPKYKTIFTYDLFNGSRTIWGQDFIEAKTVALEEVDLYEAKKIVANRIGELVCLQEAADSEEQKAAARLHWKGKLMLAISSAWLVCEGAYVSSYHGQCQTLLQLKEAANEVLGSTFAAEYKKVFDYLRDGGNEYEVTDEVLREYVDRINTYFSEKKICKSRVNTLARRAKQCLKYIKTGVSYGVINYEDVILQALIDEYRMQDNNISKTARDWHRVLY